MRYSRYGQKRGCLAALTPPIRVAWLHACDLPLRSVISGWHRYCAHYIVPACIQWDGPRQLTVRSRGWGERKGKEVGAENNQRNCEQQRCCSTGCLDSLVSERASLEQWIVLEDVIVRSLAGPVTFRIVNSSPMALLLITRSSRCPMQCLNFPFIDRQHRADRTTGILSIHKFPGIYIWFHCRCIWYKGLLMDGVDIERVHGFLLCMIFSWY